MKKGTLRILTLVMLLTAVMYNCKKKDEPFPTEPDKGLVDEINKITLPAVAATTPEAVKAKESVISVSAKTAETGTAIAAITPTNIPAAATTAAGEVGASLSAAEVATLNSVNADMITAIAAGGTVPAALKAVMDKVAADPALKAYLPTFALPTVDGVAISGNRTGASQAIEITNGVLVDDACVQKAQAAFDAAKTKLDASKATQNATIATAYAANIAPLAAAEASCTAALPAKYAALDAQAMGVAAAAQAVLLGAKDALGANYALLSALVNIQLLGYLSSANNLQAADIKACASKTTAATKNAAAARDKDLATADANYKTAIAAANAVKVKLAESCHNQGGGN